MRGATLAACTNLNQWHPDIIARWDAMLRGSIDLQRQMVELLGGSPCVKPFTALGNGYLLDLLELNKAQQEEIERLSKRQ